MRWIAALVGLLAGCERVLELSEVKPGTAAGDGAAGNAACERFDHVMAEPFGTGVVPSGDFSVDESELRAVMTGTIGASGNNVAHVLVRTNIGDAWQVDGARDTLPADLETPRIAPDGEHVFGTTQGALVNRVLELAVSGGTWSSSGVYTAPQGVRPAVTGVSGRLDQTTLAVVLFQIDPAFARLQIMSAPTWMPAPQDNVNNAGYVVAAALSLDALTLVYSVPGNGAPSLFASHRATANDPFSAGVRIALPQSAGDELDPWIVGNCTKLYFHSGSTIYVAY